MTKKQTIILLSATIFLSFLSFCHAQKVDEQKPLVAAFVNLQNVPEPFATKLAELKTAYEKGEIQNIRGLSDRLQKYYFMEEKPDGSAIPYLIALIDADNSYDTVYGVGYFSLGRMTGVKYSEFHDGAFWRCWWEKNKTQFPEEFRNIKIPELPKTVHGKTYQPYPEELETLDGKLKFLRGKFNAGKPFRGLELSGLARAITEHGDPKAIPYLIAAIEADNSYDTVYGVGYFGLGQITDVKYSSFHDGAFWRRWWEKNKSQFPEDVQNIEIPEFPKTKHGKTYRPYPEEVETLDGKLKLLRERFDTSTLFRSLELSDLPQAIAEHGDPKAIPYLIAAIEADNSHETVYGVGYFGLRDLTDVKYIEFHDGAFWRRWWEKNKTKFPQEVQKIEIPEFRKTKHGRSYVSPFPENIDTLSGQLEYLREQFAKDGKKRYSKKSQLSEQEYWVKDVVRSIVEFNDPTAIPYLISVIEAEDTDKIQMTVGFEGINRLTQTRDNRLRDAAWWKKWWEENKKNYPECVQKIGIPDIDKPWNVPDLTQEIAAWRAEKKAEEEKEALSDIIEIPCERLCAANHEKMEYFLIGPKPDVVSSKGGYKLVVVLPGGDGSADFNPFVRRILKYGLKDDYVIAQPIAVKWTKSQQIVWPTENVTVDKQEFSTEQFIEAVIADVSKKVAVDPKCVFTLSWSSSGPAAYAAALQEKTAITGSYICMSVFKPDQLPPLEQAKDRVFLIEHSPDDRVCPFRMAKEAEEKLNANGAVLKFVEYPGGHGWRGNVFERIQNNFDWLKRATCEGGTPP